MTIEQLRRMKQLSEIPTHSLASLEELKELVRQATIVCMEDSLISTCQHCKHRTCVEHVCPFYEEHSFGDCMEYMFECEHLSGVCRECMDGECKFGWEEEST